MKILFRIVTTLVLALLFVCPAQAQQDTTATEGVVRVTMEDGTIFTGVVAEQDEATIRLRMASGAEVAIPKAQVRNIEALEAGAPGARFMRPDPNRTRLLFAPNARSLRSGQGYVAVYYILFPFVAYGVADRLNLAGGISLIPATSEQLVYLAPKLTVYDGRTADAAVGVLFGTSTAFEESGGLVYGLATFGQPSKSFTAGLGFAYAEGEFSTSPAFVAGGEYQLTGSLKLLTENYIILGDDVLFLYSGGVRFFGERLAADLGLLTFPELLQDGEGLIRFVPLVSFAYNFGRTGP